MTLTSLLCAALLLLLCAHDSGITCAAGAAVVFDNTTTLCGGDVSCTLSDAGIWIGQVAPTKDDDVVIISTSARYVFVLENSTSEMHSLYMQNIGRMSIVDGSVMVSDAMTFGWGTLELVSGSLTVGARLVATRSSIKLGITSSITAASADFDADTYTYLYDKSSVSLLDENGSSSTSIITAHGQASFTVAGKITFICYRIAFDEQTTVKINQLVLQGSTTNSMGACSFQNATVDVLQYGRGAKLIVTGYTSTGDLVPDDFGSNNASGNSLQLNVTNAKFVLMKREKKPTQVSNVSFYLEKSTLSVGISYDAVAPLDLSRNTIRAVNSIIMGSFISPRTFALDNTSSIVANYVIIEQNSAPSKIGSLHVNSPGMLRLTPQVSLKFGTCEWDYGVQFYFDRSSLTCDKVTDQDMISLLSVSSNSSWTIGQQVGWVNVKDYVQSSKSVEFAFNGDLSISSNVTLASVSSVVHVDGILDVSAAWLTVNTTDVTKTASYPLIDAHQIPSNFTNFTVVGLKGGEKNYKYTLDYVNNTVYLRFTAIDNSKTVYIVLVTIICVLVAVSLGFIGVGIWQRMEMKNKQYRPIT